MKQTTIFLLFAFLLTSCAPAAIVVPTQTVIPTSTNTPLAPTITLTPAPENLADAKDLPTWVDQYVHAYSGHVTVNGVDMDASQLTDEIRKNNEMFTQVKEINGVEYLFLVVNDTPLAIRQSGNWQKVYLKTLADLQGLKVGSENRITSNFYKELNHISFSGDISWSQVNNILGVYDFSNFDRSVAEAQENGMIMRGNGIVFPTASWAMPEWLQNGDYSKEELTQILIDHVTTVVEHGKQDGVTEWAVVNEPWIADARETDIFYEAFGNYDYINIAFAAARKADPNAILIFNDTDNHATKGFQTRLTQQIVESLKQDVVVGEDGISRSVIDAVGIQAHLPEWYNAPSHEDMVKTLKSYGLPVIITELDFNLSTIQGSEEQKSKIQADGYIRLIRAAMDADVNKITFWSFSDESNWMTDQGVNDANPGLFDRDGNPKMVYFEVLKVFYELLL